MRDIPKLEYKFNKLDKKQFKEHNPLTRLKN